MKLLTHNFLSSNFLKNVQVGFPLILRASKVEKKQVEFNDAFIKRMVPKIDYPVLVQAANNIGEGNDLPKELPSDWENDNDFLKNLHELLMSVEIVDGELECPETGRKFMIREGIPNMLANEDEVEES